VFFAALFLWAMVRFKNRFLVLEAQPVDSKKKSKFLMKPHALYSAIMEKIELLYGDFGVAAVKNGFMSKYSSEITQVRIYHICSQ
jgi:Rpp14/Pop5 family